MKKLLFVIGFAITMPHCQTSKSQGIVHDAFDEMQSVSIITQTEKTTKESLEWQKKADSLTANIITETVMDMHALDRQNKALKEQLRLYILQNGKTVLAGNNIK